MAAPLDSPPPRVLVVDDDQDTRRLVRLVLEDMGFEVLTAADGQQAVRLARQDPPDVILLDYLLPDQDGDAVARQLREACGDVPLLLMSGAPDRQHKAEQVGAVSRLDKPFDLDRLEASVTRALRVAGVWTGPRVVREPVSEPHPVEGPRQQP